MKERFGFYQRDLVVLVGHYHGPMYTKYVRFN